MADKEFHEIRTESDGGNSTAILGIIALLAVAAIMVFVLRNRPAPTQTTPSQQPNTTNQLNVTPDLPTPNGTGSGSQDQNNTGNGSTDTTPQSGQ